MKTELIEDKLSAATLNQSLVEFREYEFKLPITDGPNSAIDFTKSKDQVSMLKLTDESSGYFRKITNLEEIKEIASQSSNDLLKVFCNHD